MTSLRFAERLRDLVGGVDVVLSDIWGVVHNGLVAFPEACEALHRFRDQGGAVILITNAPRPADSVQRQLRSPRLLARKRHPIRDGVRPQPLRRAQFSPAVAAHPRF